MSNDRTDKILVESKTANLQSQSKCFKFQFKFTDILSRIKVKNQRPAWKQTKFIKQLSFVIAKEKELQEKEFKLIELQEMYETRLLQLKVYHIIFRTA